MPLNPEEEAELVALLRGECTLATESYSPDSHHLFSCENLQEEIHRLRMQNLAERRALVKQLRQKAMLKRLKGAIESRLHVVEYLLATSQVYPDQMEELSLSLEHERYLIQQLSVLDS